MPKPNTMIQLMQAKQEIAKLKMDLRLIKGFTIQQSLDMAQLALHDVFGFGPARNAVFSAAFHSALVEWVDVFLRDDKDDHDLVYAKEKMDRAIRAACGDDMPSFDVRYADEKIFYWDRAESGGSTSDQ